MVKRRPPAAKLPTVHKPMKAKATDQARITYPPQQNNQLEAEVIVPPDQVPDPTPNPQDPPAHVPPVHTPELVQPQNPPAHVPDPM